MSERELERLQRAVERLMNGQQEALEAIRPVLDGSETLTEESLLDLADILRGASEDARRILELDEGGEM